MSENRLNHKAAAIVIASALLAGACGGGTDVESDALIANTAELESQVASLDNESAPTTIAAAPTTATAIVPETTVRDDPETTTTAAPVDSGQTAIELGAVDEYVTPNGPVLEAGMGFDEINAMLWPLLDSPTNDVARTAARFARFPAAVSTMPDAVIVGFEVQQSIEYNGLEPERLLANTKVEYTTSALAEDVALGYQTQLVAAGWELKGAATTSSNDVLYHVLELREPDDDGSSFFKVVAFRADDANVTTIELQFWDTDSYDVTRAKVAEGWTGNAPLLDDPYLRSVTILGSMFIKSEISYSAQYLYFDKSEEDARSEIETTFVGSDWTFDEFRGTSAYATYRGERANIAFFETAPSEVSPGRTNQTLDYRFDG